MDVPRKPCKKAVFDAASSLRPDGSEIAVWSYEDKSRSQQELSVALFNAAKAQFEPKLGLDKVLAKIALRGGCL